MIEVGRSVGRCSDWGLGWTIRVLGQPTFVPAEMRQARDLGNCRQGQEVVETGPFRDAFRARTGAGHLVRLYLDLFLKST